MPVALEIPEELTRFTAGTRLFDLPGETIGQVLESLFKQFPDLRCRIVDDQGRLHPYLPIFLDGHKLPPRGSLDRPVADGSHLEIIGLASGG